MNVRRRSTAVLLSALAVAGTLASASAARATICFPAGSGVPGAPGVPKWWGGASSSGRDDPRWRGAAMFNHTGDQLKARVVVDNSGADKYLVMMWSVNADPTAGNLLYFGFYNDGATAASSTGTSSASRARTAAIRTAARRTAASDRARSPRSWTRSTGTAPPGRPSPAFPTSRPGSPTTSAWT